MNNYSLPEKIDFKLKEIVKLLYVIVVMVGFLVIFINSFIITMIFTQSSSIIPYLTGGSLLISIIIVNIITRLMPTKIGIKQNKFYVVPVFSRKQVEITGSYRVIKKTIFWRNIYTLESNEHSLKKIVINPYLYKKGDTLEKILLNEIN